MNFIKYCNTDHKTFLYFHCTTTYLFVFTHDFAYSSSKSNILLRLFFVSFLYMRIHWVKCIFVSKRKSPQYINIMAYEYKQIIKNRKVSMGEDKIKYIYLYIYIFVWYIDMYLWKTITHWMWRGRNRLKWLNRLLKYILFISFSANTTKNHKSTAEFISWIFLIQPFNSKQNVFLDM